MKVVVKNDHQVVVKVIAHEAVHHYSVLIMQIIVCLVVFVQHPICEEVPVEADETDA